jgi:hypothetical protein
MDAFTIFTAISGLLLAVLSIRVAIYIARRQGAFRQEKLFVSLSLPQLFPLGSRSFPFSKPLGPPGGARMGSVYPVMMKAPPCVAINVSSNSGKHIFFLLIAVCNAGDKASNAITLRIVTSSNLAAEKTTELGKINGIETYRKIIEDHGELHISHEIGKLKPHDNALIGEVFSIDPDEFEIGEKVVRVVLNISAQSEESYCQSQIMLFLVRVESKSELIQSLAYHAKMDYHSRISLVGRILSLGRAHGGRPSLWIFPDYERMPDGVYLHKFNRPGDRTEAGLLAPAPLGNFMEI